jgi:hypothetical protein
MEKQSIHLKVPQPTFERMTKTMKRERLTNKTGFILNAIDAICEENGKETSTEKIEKAVAILAENVRISEENARVRHLEMMVWLDTLADAVLGGDKADIANFHSIVQRKIQQRKGTN